MHFTDIVEIIKVLELDDCDNFYFQTLQQEYATNNIYPLPSNHCFIRVEIRGDELNTFIKNNSIWINSYENIVWLLKDIKNSTKFKKLREVDPSIITKNDALYLYTPPQKHRLDTREFIELIYHLRSPEGCPWDRKQTHFTLRTNLLEETYEVLEAIDQEDSDHLKEELGDLLLQIVLHAQIALEEHTFDFGNIVNDVYWKIRNRHPHVFEDTSVEDVKEVMTNWEKIKAKERGDKKVQAKQSILESIPLQLPALSIAQKYQERASRVGFDWEDISPVFDKVLEELQEVRDALQAEDVEEELGDLLFAVVNLVRWGGFDAETCLRMTNTKFKNRFQYIEKKVSDNGQSLTDLSLSELDFYWDEAKGKLC